MKILNRWDDSRVLWEGEAGSIREAVSAAVREGANLTGADLTGANLTGTNLTDATLTDAALAGATLTGANLTDATLAGADLTGATLTDATLARANLTDATLAGATLAGANLTGATLRGATLAGANLTGANLRGATLRGATLTDARHLRLPTGETWMEYLTETVPALLTAGGKSLESFGPAFGCHSWKNCPMAHAFDVHRIEDVPILLRPRADQFIQLFDAKKIPWPLPTKADLEVKDF